MTKRLIRVVIPYHLQTLAKTGPEIAIELAPPFTGCSLLDAIELRYPSLRGTIRDQVTKQRRPLLRYFACSNDISHESPSLPLPQAIVDGDEPFIIWGAIAGG